MFEPSENIEAS